MENAKQHWKILQKLGNDLENRVRSFLVIGKNGEGVIVSTEDGQGYWLGTIQFNSDELRTATEPTPLDVPGLVQMAQSDNHILLLNKRGQIYSMGRNNYGQMGLDWDQETRFSPQLIFISRKFTSVRCGHAASIALTEDGKVWEWGFNRKLLSPHQILKLDTHRIVAIECGGLHCLALTDQGEVYGWGSNHCGQLGDGIEIFATFPTQIFTPSPVKSMAASYSHTLLLTQTGVYACGGGRQYQLDLSTATRSIPSLSKVAGLPPISQIASHSTANLSIAMSFDNRCFVWGEMADKTFISTPQELPLNYSTVDSPLSSFSKYRYTPHSVSIPETPSNQLPGELSRMFDNPETSDVQFVVEQKTIHAHRIILSNSSDYFARMFSERWVVPVDPGNPIVKVTIPDHSYQVFHVFLRFLYTDCLEPHSDLLPELFDLATHYLVPDLLELCLLRLRTTLTSATCCHYYQLTLKHPIPELDAFQHELVQFISSNFLEVFATLEYQSMNAELCKKLTLSMSNQSP